MGACVCAEPLRHTCGSFMVFDGEKGNCDVYYCNNCDCQVLVQCRLTGGDSNG